MESVEAITRSQNIVARFCNLNISEDEISASIINDAGKIAKIQVVGSKQTVKAVTEFMAKVRTTSLNLMLKRSGLIRRQSTIRMYESYRDQKQQEIGNYIASLKSQNILGSADQRLWDVISRHINFEQDQYDKYQKELDDLLIQQNKEHFQFIRECMDRFFDISNILPEAVLAVRNELGLEIAPEEYLEIFNQNIEDGRKVFNAFIHQMESG